jgi:AraC-like DNA-binding protein
MNESMNEWEGQLFQPTRLNRGKIEPLARYQWLELYQCLASPDPGEELRELLQKEYLVCSVVPAEGSAPHYQDQIRLLTQIANQLCAAMKEFYGVVFLSNGRVYLVFGLTEGEEWRTILNKLESAMERLRSKLHCDVQGVSNGPWKPQDSPGRALFNIDEIWRYFSFREEKPMLLHHTPEQVEPENFPTWADCWAYHQKNIISGFQQENLPKICAGGDALITDVIAWGSPIVWKTSIRALQLMNSLCNELMRQNLLGLQRAEDEVNHYDNCLRNIDSERDLRNLMRQELELLYRRSQAYARQKGDQLIRDIKVYIEGNLSDYNLSAASVAKAFHLSAESMGMKFRQGSPVNVSEYIHLRRVERIKELLVNTDMTVDKIMESTGYFSRSTMYRAFTRLTGMTPKMYRSAHVNQSAAAM